VYSQFRALENRRYLLRATNTGMTAIITPRGELYDKLAPFKETFLLQNLKLERAESLYTRFGERCVYGLALLCTIIFVYTVIKYKLGPVKKEF
jgi:apolipoprotein N-acyltransferase